MSLPLYNILFRDLLEYPYNKIDEIRTFMKGNFILEVFELIKLLRVIHVKRYNNKRMFTTIYDIF